MVDRFDARFRAIFAMRKVAWAAALLGAYLTLFGVGAQTRTVAAYGGAVLLVGVAVRVAAGILDRMPPTVRGVGVVRSVSGMPGGRCELKLTVSRPGLRAAVETVHEAVVPEGKWPDRGQSLPVGVTLSLPARVRVLWDEVTERRHPADSDAYLDPVDPVDEVGHLHHSPADEPEPMPDGPVTDELVLVDEAVPTDQPEPRGDETAVPPPLRRPRPRPRTN
jgi:hypothetical protein